MARLPYFKAEEFTVPLRFILLTSNFISVLAVTFGLYEIAGNITQVNPSIPNTPQVDIDNYDSTYNLVSGFAYTALACCSVEFITLFMGVTIFICPMMLMHLVAHLLGLILTVLFYERGWPVDAWIATVVTFNIVPVVLELSVLAFMSSGCAYARF